MVVNSIIVKPEHHEVVEFHDDMHGSGHEKITFEGFAYTGGGRRVIVVEVSVNEGHDWTMAELFVSHCHFFKYT